MEDISRSLRAIWTIAMHEVSLYFGSLMFYLSAGVWLMAAGLFFSWSIGNMNANPNATPGIDGLLNPVIFTMMFVAPALTMRLLAEEIRNGTHELIQTAPVRDGEIIVGKWLGVMIVFIAINMITLLHAALIILRSDPTPDIYPILTGYLALVLVSGAAFAIGIFASSLTQHQAISFLIGMVIMLFLWLANAVVGIFQFQSGLTDIVSELTLSNHFQGMVNQAIIDWLDVAYFVGVTMIFLFLAAQIINIKRWRA